jgi:hypothetical protein
LREREREEEEEEETREMFNRYSTLLRLKEEEGVCVSVNSVYSPVRK